jgi:hypothetical protein
LVCFLYGLPRAKLNNWRTERQMIVSMICGDSFRRMPEAEQALESITRMNAELEDAVSPLLMTEKTLEGCWCRARRLKVDGPSYWLLLARLTEAALLCAGNYADNCEYETAGDFLVNPREILVHRRGDSHSATKNRHGRLTEQFGLEGFERHNNLKHFSAGVQLEITKPPLLPHMTQVLRGSGFISPAYLQRLEEGQRRIADTLAFLSAWRIFDSTELWRRLQASSARERAFAEAHLCRFDARVFHRIGADLRRSMAEPDYRSPFLAEPHMDENGLKRTPPATAPALVGMPA